MYHVAILELHLEGRIGQIYLNLSLHLDEIFLVHASYLPGNPAPLKFAFFNRLSY